jgi:hypothetical protein
MTSPQGPSQTPPGWYPDPQGSATGLLVDTVDWSTGWGAWLAFLASLALAGLAFFLATNRRTAA